MCNCGRKSTEVITSAQAQGDVAARQMQDAAANEAQQIQSAANAMANSGSSWQLVPAE